MSDQFPGSNSIIKRQIDLMEAYAEYVSFVPTAKHMAEFELDATRMHPTLLRDSIKAAAATGIGKGKTPSQQRRIVHQIYARKAKEMAALWPFIFSVENALRAALTEHYHTKFAKRDWWRQAEKSVLAATSIPNIFCGSNISNALARSIERITKSLMDNSDAYSSLRQPNNVNRFFYFLSLGQLAFFFEDDWTDLRNVFIPGMVKGQVITKASIIRDIQTVRIVRNEIYHSNPVRDTQSFLKAVEGLSLALDINAYRFDDDLRLSKLDRPLFTDFSSGSIPAR